VQSFVLSLQPFLLALAFVSLLVVSHHSPINQTGKASALHGPSASLSLFKSDLISAAEIKSASEFMSLPQEK
jgi:hypothetical protein